MMDNYSLSDIKAVTSGEEGFGGGGAWWIIILFLFVFMGGGVFGGAGGANSALTRAEMQQGFDTQEITRKLDGLTNGLCDGFYAQNTNMLNGFAGVNASTQACCCETNRNIDNVRFENAQNTCAITNAVHAEAEATRNLIQANEMQALRDKVQELSLAQSQCAQNAYLTNTLRPYPAPMYPVSNPLCGFNGGCAGC